MLLAVLNALKVQSMMTKSTCRDIVCNDGYLQKGEAKAGIPQRAGVLLVVSVDQ